MEKKLAHIEDIASKEFDFVIIGGGTAGCVLASRLSEDPNVSVAVLEAAPSHLDDPVIPDPMGWMKQMVNPEYDWMYWSIEQPQVREKEPFLFPRGRSLGGTSAINFMIWQSPLQEEVNAWGALGNPGWDWPTFHKHAKAVGRYIPTKSNHTPDFQDLYNAESVGYDGMLPLSFSRTGCGLEAPFQKALEKHGVTTVTDYLSGKFNGTMKSMANVDPATGNRVDACQAYLVPALDRQNLKVLTEAPVHRIITSGGPDGIVATAVEFEHGGKTYQVSVRKEAVVSAGCVKSPQILELSGIGDPRILEPAGIPVKVNLPGVGSNVQEHVTMAYGLYKMNDNAGRLLITSDMLKDSAFVKKLHEDNPGLDIPWKLMLNSISFIPLQIASDKADVFVDKLRAKLQKNRDKYPAWLMDQYDIQLKLLQDKDTPDFEIVLFPFAFPDSFPEPEKPHCSLMPQLMRPFSRGTIHIGSADPMAHPIIDPRYLEEEIDLETLMEGFRFIRKVTDTEPFKSLVEKEVLPGREEVHSDSDEEVSAMVKKASWSSWHTCGSNSMLPREKNGVVDPNLKVYGTKNIRVCDLSVVPLMPTTHTQMTVYTFAEIGAERIKATHGLN